MSIRITEIQKGILFATVLGAPLYLVRFRVGAVPTNMLEVLVVLCVLVWCLGHIYNRTRPRVPPWWKPAAFIVMGGVVSTLAAPPELWIKSFGILKGFIFEPMLVGLIASDVFYKPKLPTTNYQLLRATQNILFAIIASAVVMAVVALAAYFGFARDAFITWDGRLRGIFLSPNHLAMTLGPAAVLAAGLALFLQTKKIRLLAALALFLIVPALWLTQSFGGILSALFAVGALLFWALPHLSSTSYYLQRRIVLGIAILIIILTAAFISLRHAPNLSNPRSSFASRVIVWRVSGEILKDHWLFGIGPGNFQEYYLAQQKKFPPYLEWAVPQPHNLFLAFWLQTGLFGLIGFLMLVWQILRSLSRHLSFRAVATMALFSIVAHGLVDTPYWKNDLALVFYVLLSLCAFSDAGSNEPNQGS